MRLFIPWEPGQPADMAAMREAALAVTAELHGLELYTVAGLSVRMRFLTPLPQGEESRELPREPSLPSLAFHWSEALDGILWEAAGQIGVLGAVKEWTRGPAGVEVSL